MPIVPVIFSRLNLVIELTRWRWY